MTASSTSSDSNSSAAASAVARYQEVIAQLYLPVAAAMPRDEVERGGALITEDSLRMRGPALAAASEQVRLALTGETAPENGERGQLASLQLVAAAASDLALADELLRHAPQTDSGATPEFAERGSDGAWAALRSDESLQDLRDVLDAPLDKGFASLLDGERGTLPDFADADQARDELTKTIKSFLAGIPDGAAKAGQHAVVSAVTAGLAPLQNTASLAADAVLGELPAGISLFLQHAAELAAAAIRKLLDALGPQLSDEARNQVNSWMKQFKENTGVATNLLNRLYETDRIGEEVNRQVTAAPNEKSAPFNTANGKLQDLQARYDKAHKVVMGALHIVDLARTTLIATGPWGVAAVYTSYTAILGYAVYSGGDYLDWYLTGQVQWLDRVTGLRAVIHEALPPSPTPVIEKPQ